MEYMGYCGLLCNECPLYIATLNQDEEMKARLAVEYSNEKCAFVTEDMTCEGCFSEKNNDSKMCGDCEIRKCAVGKDFRNCGECSSYPCTIIEKLMPVDSENRNRLNTIAGIC